MRPPIVLLLLTALAACGAAGAPERPGPEPAGERGARIDVSGTAGIGVTGSM